MPRFYLGGALQRGESITWTGSIADVTIFLEAFPTNQSARGRSLVKLAYTWDIPSTCFNAGAYPGADWNSEDNCLLSASRSLTGVAAPPGFCQYNAKWCIYYIPNLKLRLAGWFPSRWSPVWLHLPLKLRTVRYVSWVRNWLPHSAGHLAHQRPLGSFEGAWIRHQWGSIRGWNKNMK